MKRIMLHYEHPKCEVDVDIYLPLPPNTGVETLGQKRRPNCPICGELMRFATWAPGDELPST